MHPCRWGDRVGRLGTGVRKLVQGCVNKSPLCLSGLLMPLYGHWVLQCLVKASEALAASSHCQGHPCFGDRGFMVTLTILSTH